MLKHVCDPVSGVIMSRPVDLGLQNAFIDTAAEVKNVPRGLENLLKTGRVNVNHLGTKGTTALINAVLRDAKESVQFLTEQPNIDLNLPDKFGKTALIYCAQ